MFQATDSFLQLRANAEDTWQMIPVLEENHRFNMHSKWYCQYHQHDMQKKKNCCICIPCGYRTTYTRLNFICWVSHGVLDAEIEPALILFSTGRPCFISVDMVCRKFHVNSQTDTCITLQLLCGVIWQQKALLGLTVSETINSHWCITHILWHNFWWQFYALYMNVFLDRISREL